MLSCCRDQIQEVTVFLERVQGHLERLSFSEQTAPASWGERVSLDSTRPGSMKPLTEFLRKLAFCCSPSIDQNRGASVSCSSTYRTDALGRDQGRMHSAGIKAATLAAADTTLSTCRSCRCARPCWVGCLQNPSQTPSVTP